MCFSKEGKWLLYQFGRNEEIIGLDLMN